MNQIVHSRRQQLHSRLRKQHNDCAIQHSRKSSSLGTGSPEEAEARLIAIQSFDLTQTVLDQLICLSRVSEKARVWVASGLASRLVVGLQNQESQQKCLKVLSNCAAKWQSLQELGMFAEPSFLNKLERLIRKPDLAAECLKLLSNLCGQATQLRDKILPFFLPIIDVAFANSKASVHSQEMFVWALSNLSRVQSDKSANIGQRAVRAISHYAINYLLSDDEDTLLSCAFTLDFCSRALSHIEILLENPSFLSSSISVLQRLKLASSRLLIMFRRMAQISKRAAALLSCTNIFSAMAFLLKKNTGHTRYAKHVILLTASLLQFEQVQPRLLQSQLLPVLSSFVQANEYAQLVVLLQAVLVNCQDNLLLDNNQWLLESLRPALLSNFPMFAKIGLQCVVMLVKQKSAELLCLVELHQLIFELARGENIEIADLAQTALDLLLVH